MRTPTRPTAAVALALAFAAPAAARAQITVYTDLAAFLAATSNAGTDTFNDLAAGPVSAGPLARTAGAFGYTASATTLGLYGAGPAGDRWLTTDVATDLVTFTGFGPTLRGVGGFFFGTDLDGAFRAGTSLTLRATDAGGTTTRTLASATTGSFLGFVSAGAVTSLTVEAAQPSAADLAWPTVNGLVLAGAPAAAVVPEPATVLLLGAGAAVLVPLAARRRRRLRRRLLGHVAGEQPAGAGAHQPYGR